MNKEAKKKEAIDKIKGKKFLIRPLRTFEDDVANLVKKQKVSTAKIVMAEQVRRLEQKDMGIKEVEAVIVPPQKPKKTLFKKKNLHRKITMYDQRIANVDGAQILEEKTVRKIKSKKALNVPQSVKNKEKQQLPIKGILSITLVILGIVLIISAVVFTDIENRILNIVQIDHSNEEENLIQEDTNVAIYTDNKTAREIRGLVQSKISQSSNLGLKDILEIKIQKRSISNVEGSSGSQDISTSEFFRVLESSAPESLVRSLHSDFMLGVINIGTVKPFILFRTNDLDQSYASMFEWESTLYRDINDIFYTTLGLEDFYNPDSEPTPTFDPRSLKDEIMINRDTRAIVDDSGEILFFYSFIDSEHLLMTSDIEALREIIQRLNVQRLIR